METHRLLKTIGEETRLRILVLLLDSELNVTELETVLSTAQSNVSRHLAKLLAAELVTCRRAHHNVFYCLNHAELNRRPFLMQLFYQERNQPQGLADLKNLDALQSLSHTLNPYRGSETHSDDHLI
jgi:ArsR family transcriptional regulator